MSHLRNLRSKNAGNIIFSYLNTNSIKNKFENLCQLVAGNVDILFKNIFSGIQFYHKKDNKKLSL